MIAFYPHVRIEKYVVMPNHIHLLIAIQQGPSGASRTPPPYIRPRKPGHSDVYLRFETADQQNCRACTLAARILRPHHPLPGRLQHHLALHRHQPRQWAQDTRYVTDFPDPVRRPEPLPTIEEIRASLAEDGITHVAVTTADVLDDTRAELFRRRSEGLHGEMKFTYRDPERSTDPLRAVAGAKSVIVAARPYLTSDDPARPDAAAGPHARVGRYAWVDHYAPLRVALRDVAKRIRRAGHRAVHI